MKRVYGTSKLGEHHRPELALGKGLIRGVFLGEGERRNVRRVGQVKNGIYDSQCGSMVGYKRHSPEDDLPESERRKGRVNGRIWERRLQQGN